MRLRATAAAMVAGAALAAGCGSEQKDEPELEFQFAAERGLGFISQTLDIRNPGGGGVAPRLEIVPLDAKGDRVPGVTVRTALGSDRGRVVVPPRTAVLDVVRFDGARRYDVESVDVRVAAAEEVAATPWEEEVVAERLDRRGRVVEYGIPFTSVRITNPNAGPVRVRVVLIEHDAPPEGERQQFARLTPLDGLMTVETRGRRTIRLPPGLRERIVASALVYPSR